MSSLKSSWSNLKPLVGLEIWLSLKFLMCFLVFVVKLKVVWYKSQVIPVKSQVHKVEV